MWFNISPHHDEGFTTIPTMTHHYRGEVLELESKCVPILVRKILKLPRDMPLIPPKYELIQKFTS